MSQTRYLNTDLEIQSSSDLTKIVEAFGDDVIVLYNGKWGEKVNKASFEVSHIHSSVNETIEFFCMLVENLAPQERDIWDSCFSKVFDIGYDTGVANQSFQSLIRPEVIERIVSIGAHIAITIYPPASGDTNEH